MMRKFMAFLLILIMLLSLNAYSAEVTLKNAGEDIITVSSNEISGGSNVSVLILNPGYSDGNILSDGAISYYARGTAGSESFSMDVPMYDTSSTGGGQYTLILSTAGKKEAPYEFIFCFIGKKLEMIDKLNDPDVANSGIIDEIYSVYSLNTSSVFKSTKTESIAGILELKKSYDRDVDTMLKELESALCIAAYSDGTSELVKNGRLSYTDVLELDGTELYNEYLTKLSDKGVQNVNEAVLGGPYKTTADIKNAFDEAVLVNQITNYKEMGYGHVAGYLSKYSSEYEAAGIKLSRLSSLVDKNGVYNSLQAAKNADMAALAELYKQLTEPKPQGNPGTKPHGNGGGVGGSAVPKPADKNDAYIENTSTPFSDIADVEWAQPSIGKLYRLGAISGKTADIFAPHDNVTRAEYIKMIISAIFGEISGAENPFSDVNGWAEKYISFAKAKGIASGISDTLFAPDTDISREQAACIAGRILRMKNYTSENEADEFSDDASISSWAKEDVYYLAAAGIINGRGEGNYEPAANMTRAEAAKLICGIYDTLGGEMK